MNEDSRRCICELCIASDLQQGRQIRYRTRSGTIQNPFPTKFCFSTASWRDGLVAGEASSVMKPMGPSSQAPQARYLDGWEVDV